MSRVPSAAADPARGLGSSLGYQAAAAALLVALAGPAYAATLCANSAAGIAQALDQADSNNAHDVIRIATGQHMVADLRYNGLSNDEGFDLTLSGGWNPSCTSQISDSPFDTTLDGSSLNNILTLSSESGTDVVLENLLFINGDDDPGIAPVRILINPALSDSTARVERCAFIGNSGLDPTLQVLAGGNDEIRIMNSLFTGNHGGVVSVRISDAGQTYFINNTVVSNTVSNVSDIGGLDIDGFDSGSSVTRIEVLVVNNIFWNNQGIDLAVDDVGTATFLLWNNNYGTRTGRVPDEDTNNFISVDPMFEPGLYNFTPEFPSEMLDAGRHPPTFTPFPVPFRDDWKVGSLDAIGRTRIQGGRVDIGAYEATPEVIFKNGYE